MKKALLLLHVVVVLKCFEALIQLRLLLFFLQDANFSPQIVPLLLPPISDPFRLDVEVFNIIIVQLHRFAEQVTRLHLFVVQYSTIATEHHFSATT